MKIRRIFVGIVGLTILMIGLVLLVIPGPGLLVVLLGLAVLASEFIWAEHIMAWLKSRLLHGKIGR